MALLVHTAEDTEGDPMPGQAEGKVPDVSSAGSDGGLQGLPDSVYVAEDAAAAVL